MPLIWLGISPIVRSWRSASVIGVIATSSITKDVGAGDLGEHTRAGPVRTGERQLGEEPRGSTVDSTMPLPARLPRECARDVGLAGAGLAGDQDVLVLGHPAARTELADLRLVEFALGRIVDVLSLVPKPNTIAALVALPAVVGGSTRVTPTETTV